MHYGQLTAGRLTFHASISIGIRLGPCGLHKGIILALCGDVGLLMTHCFTLCLLRFMQFQTTVCVNYVIHNQFVILFRL